MHYSPRIWQKRRPELAILFPLPLLPSPSSSLPPLSARGPGSQGASSRLSDCHCPCKALVECIEMIGLDSGRLQNRRGELQTASFHSLHHLPIADVSLLVVAKRLAQRFVLGVSSGRMY